MRVHALALASLALAGSAVWGGSRAVVPGTAVAMMGCAPEPAARTAEPAPSEAAPPTTVDDRCPAPESISVLFVGNSYTLMHDLPAVFARMGAQSGVEIHAESLAQGGQGFAYHVGRDKLATKLKDHSWDVVVLQAHSLDPLRDRASFLRNGSKLIDAVRSHGATPILFETWARRQDSNLYNYDERTGGSPQVMQERIHDSYTELGRKTGVEVVEVGQTWRRVKTASPTIKLYASDASHPTQLGTYLTASTFFSALLDQPPPAESRPEGADPTAVEVIHGQAAAAIADECSRPDLPG